MKKVISIISIVIMGVMLLTLTGCTSSKSYTFDVETGDRVEITLNTSEGHDLSYELPFTISKDDKTLSQGTFIKGNYYSEYVNVANTDSLATVLDTGSNDDIEYVFYSYNDSEYNYIIKVKDSNTGIILGNPNSREEAEECFELLTFSLDEE